MILRQQHRNSVLILHISVILEAFLVGTHLIRGEAGDFRRGEDFFKAVIGEQVDVAFFCCHCSGGHRLMNVVSIFLFLRKDKRCGGTGISGRGVIILETGEDGDRPFRGRAGFIAFLRQGLINRALPPV